MNGRDFNGHAPPQAEENEISNPKCSICGEISSGIHFGAEACAACSAFFRRTIVLGKNYKCANSMGCKLQKGIGNGHLCRACRIERCIEVGMEKGAVQHRRDAIGQYSRRYAAIKRKSDMGSSESCGRPSSTSSSHTENTTSTGSMNILEEICSSYHLYQKRRKVFYCNNSLSSLFDDDKELESVEIRNFRECFFQILRIEPRLCVEFIDSIKSLKQISPMEKANIYSNFILKLQAIEEPYLTWKNGGMHKGKQFWMMQNKNYIMFSRISTYFKNDVMKGLNLDEKTAKNIFIPSFEHALQMVGQKMAALDLEHKELCALIGIVLLDPNALQLSVETRHILQSFRNQLFVNLLEFEQKRTATNSSLMTSKEEESPEVRLGNLILSVMPGIVIHSQRTRQNMHMLQIFNVVPGRDELFDQINGIL